MILVQKQAITLFGELRQGYFVGAKQNHFKDSIYLFSLAVYSAYTV